MNISRKREFQLLPLNFENVVLKLRENHKHLGVILQDNGKWDTHIKSIIARSCILIACLRSYKHRLSRKSLENMYISFILPIFDYVDVVRDKCTLKLADELEELYLVGDITGAVRGTSHQSYKIIKNQMFNFIEKTPSSQKYKFLCHKM